MKKKILLILMLLFSLYIVPVHAENAWPKIYTSGDFKYKVEGFSLKIYETNRSDNNSEEFISDSYVSGTPDEQIALKSSDFTINPTAKTGKLGQTNSTFIDLNLNITNDDLKTLLQSKMSSVTSTKGYIVELAVHFQLPEYPSSYTKAYNYNTIRDIMNLSQNNKSLIKTSDLGERAQVINVITVEYDETTSSPKLTYETTVTEENNLETGVLNYLALYNNEATIESNPNYILMFHNIDNIDYIINDLKDSEQTNTAPSGAGGSTSNKEGETVKVDDTAQSVPILLYFTSLLSLLIGSGLVIYTIEKEKQQQIN